MKFDMGGAVARRVSSSASHKNIATAATSTIALRYLKAFGYNRDLNLPSVFNIQYGQHWQTFCDHFVSPSIDTDRGDLYRVLEFCRYMKAINLNPFLRPFVDPVSKTKFNVEAAYKVLMQESLSAFAASIDLDMRRLRLTQLLVAQQSKFLVQYQKKSYVVSFGIAFVPKSGDGLDKVLPQLKGALYTQTNMPIQFQESRKSFSSRMGSQLPTADTLLNDINSYGWLKVSALKGYSIFATRARNGILVVRFRFEFPIEVVFGPKAQTINTITGLWSKIKPIL